MWVIGSLSGIGWLISGVMLGDAAAYYGGIFTLLLTPIIGITRARVLTLYSLIGKLLREVERLRGHCQEHHASKD